MRDDRIFAAGGPYLFSPAIDLAVFAGSAVAAWLLVAVGRAAGVHDGDAPEWIWLSCVVGIDVAHVWSTGFRVYFDAAEVRRRPLLYLGLPVVAYLIGVGAHAFGPAVFWRMLAYVAVFHFVRQQVGFMKLYQRRDRDLGRADVILERATMYAVMLYPLVYWHGSLPRNFAWMLQGDFAEELGTLARPLVPFAELVTVVLLACFSCRQVVLASRRHLVLGKPLLVLATASSWIGGIVWFDSDFVFTVTNVLLHGVPYFVLTYRHARASAAPSLARRVVQSGFVPFVLVCVALAFSEEWLWDGLVWHERTYLFGAHESLSGAALTLVVPLLALPQLTHYLLDGFVWRVRSENPVLRRELE